MQLVILIVDIARGPHLVQRRDCDPRLLVFVKLIVVILVLLCLLLEFVCVVLALYLGLLASGGRTRRGVLSWSPSLPASAIAICRLG